MVKDFERVVKILSREFGKNRKLYLATSSNNIPKVEIVNTYYWNKSFYIVADESTEVFKRILANCKVSLCSTASLHKFQGEAFDIGHPLKAENEEVRDVLLNAKSNWYQDHNDESEAGLHLIQVKITTGFTYASKTGYNFDFEADEVNSFKMTSGV